MIPAVIAMAPRAITLAKYAYRAYTVYKTYNEYKDSMKESEEQDRAQGKESYIVEYKGRQFDLNTLENTSKFVEGKLRATNNPKMAEGLKVATTLSVQMVKIAKALISSNEKTEEKQMQTDEAIARQDALQKEGLIMSKEEILANPEKAQQYMDILQSEYIQQQSRENEQKRMETAKARRNEQREDDEMER